MTTGMIGVQYGAPLGAQRLAVVSRDLLELDVAGITWDVDTGGLRCQSGQVASWSRGVTLASVADATGATYTAQAAQPAWEMRDWDGDGVRESFGLRMGADDRLAVPVGVLVPGAMHGLLEIIETGARTTSGATLFALRNDGASGAGVWLDTSGTYYRLTYSDGASTRTATLTVGQPAPGDRVRLTWSLAGDGVITLYQSINGAAATTATASALTLPSAWASGVAWRLNSRGTSANPGQAWYRRVRVRAGALSEPALVERR